MGRIAIFGTCPLPFEGLPVAGPSLRTAQFAMPLLDDGHDVLLLGLRPDGLYPKRTPAVVESEPRARLTYLNASYAEYIDEDWLRAQLEEFQPTALLAAGSLLPNAMAARFVDMAPLWADIFGDPISELQSKGGAYSHDETREAMYHVWKLLTSVLIRADRFSALSGPQKLALIGELALCGRLNAANDGHALVSSIPCGVEESDATPMIMRAPDKERAFHAEQLGMKSLAEAIRKGPPPFVLLWSGSYNTWIDADGLRRGLELALEHVPDLHYVSVGGGTPGYNARIYDDFKSAVEHSSHCARCHLQGWVPFEHMRGYYDLADAGLNFDRFTYEGLLGSRNRVVQFLASAVPVMTTVLSEITRDLEAREFITSFPMGNPEGFANAVAVAAGRKKEMRLAALRGRTFVLDEYGFRRSTEAARAWLAAPQRAPDNALILARKDSIATPSDYTLPMQRFLDGGRIADDMARLEANQAPPIVARFRRLKRRLRG